MNAHSEPADFAAEESWREGTHPDGMCCIFLASLAHLFPLLPFPPRSAFCNFSTSLSRNISYLPSCTPSTVSGPNPTRFIFSTGDLVNPDEAGRANDPERAR